MDPGEIRLEAPGVVDPMLRVVSQTDKRFAPWVFALPGEVDQDLISELPRAQRLAGSFCLYDDSLGRQ